MIIQKDNYKLIITGKFCNLLYNGKSVYTTYVNKYPTIEEMIQKAKLSQDKKQNIDEAVERHLNIMSEIKKQIPEELSKGARVEIVCPICKGKMIYQKSSYNGHISIHCIDNSCFGIIQ